MKLIFKNNNAPKAAFNVGELVRWNEDFFDGRVHECIVRTGTIIKVNRTTVDVQNERGDIFRGYPEELAPVKFC